MMLSMILIPELFKPIEENRFIKYAMSWESPHRRQSLQQHVEKQINIFLWTTARTIFSCSLIFFKTMPLKYFNISFIGACRYTFMLIVTFVSIWRNLCLWLGDYGDFYVENKLKPRYIKHQWFEDCVMPAEISSSRLPWSYKTLRKFQPSALPKPYNHGSNTILCIWCHQLMHFIRTEKMILQHDNSRTWLDPTWTFEYVF